MRRKRPSKAASLEIDKTLRKQPAGAAPLQAALIALDPKSGAVRALVGGRDFVESNYNRALLARRQPGSAFKPFVYAAAVEDGWGPDDTLDDLFEPTEIANAAWDPDDEHLEEDSVSLRDGLRLSSNRAAVKLLSEIGLPKTMKSARAFGFDDLPNVPSVALGSGEVTLASITSAYGAFANGGVITSPSLIRRVVDSDGVVLFESTEVSKQAIRPITAYLMADMLRGVIDAGTGNGARRYGFTLPAGGKTGTTNDYKDAWFVGFTPSVVAGVWVGFDQPRTIRRGGYASELAVPVWGRFMKAATKGHKPAWVRRPSGADRDARLARAAPLEADDRIVLAAQSDGWHHSRNRGSSQEEARLLVADFRRRRQGREEKATRRRAVSRHLRHLGTLGTLAFTVHTWRHGRTHHLSLEDHLDPGPPGPGLGSRRHTPGAPCGATGAGRCRCDLHERHRSDSAT